MTRTVEITHGLEFSAAHRLESPSLSEQENRALYGPCFGDHGHNYRIEVTVRGEVDSSTGMVMNLADLAVILREEVWEPMDHKHLNHDVAFLEGVITTAENVAMVCWDRLAPRIAEHPGCRLHEITLFESGANRATYRGPAA